jgi:hypothetical protein
MNARWVLAGAFVAACSPQAPVVTAPTLGAGERGPVSVVAVSPSASSPDETEPPPEPDPPPLRRPALAQGLPPGAPSPPMLAAGTCVLGTPPVLPPLSAFAQQLCGPAQHATFVQQTPPGAASNIAMQLRVLELALDGAPRRDPRTLPMMLYVTARTYAQLECIEADLCAGATATGNAKDVAAAKAARQRMEDLCAELAMAAGAGVRCP